jgi:hypothetical protein
MDAKKKFELKQKLRRIKWATMKEQNKKHLTTSEQRGVMKVALEMTTTPDSKSQVTDKPENSGRSLSGEKSQVSNLASLLGDLSKMIGKKK